MSSNTTPSTKKTSRGRPAKDKVVERLTPRSPAVAAAAVGGASNGTSELCSKCHNDSDKWISCERCLMWFCLNCAELSEEEHAFFTRRQARAHWYCNDCEAQAVKAVSTDQAIEERCKEFLGEFQTRLESVENKLNDKADKAVTDSIITQNKVLEDKIVGLQNDISNLGKQIKLARFEPFEKEKRKNNIVIRGLPETGNLVEDQDLVRFTLNEIDCSHIIPTNIQRLGKIPETDASDGAQARPPARPIRCILLNSDQKSTILKNAKKVRNSDTTRFDNKRVFIIPDQTALEREDDIELRKKTGLVEEKTHK